MPIVLFAVAVFYLIVLDVVIYSIKLPSDVQGVGFDPETVTERAIETVPIFIRNAVIEAQPNDNPSGGIQYCRNRDFFLNKLMSEAGMDILAGVELGSKLPDWTIPKQGFSVASFALSFRRFVGFPVVELSPSLRWKDGTLLLTLDVRGSNNTSVRLETEFDNPKEIERKLTKLIAFSLAPDFAAYITGIGDSQEYDKFRKISKIIGNDTGVLFKINLFQMMHLSGTRRTYADSDYDIALAQKLGADLIIELPLDDSDGTIELLIFQAMARGLQSQRDYRSDIGPDARKRILADESYAEIFRELQKRDFDYEAEEWIRIAKSFANENSKEHAILLSGLYFKLKMETEAISVLDGAFRDFVPTDLAGAEALFLGSIFSTFFHLTLGDPASAKEISGSALERGWAFNGRVDPSFYASLAGFQAVSSLALGDLEAVESYLRRFDVAQTPCVSTGIVYWFSKVLSDGKFRVSDIESAEKKAIYLLLKESLDSSSKCNTHRPEGIGCCDGQTIQTPQQRGTLRDLCRASTGG
ncbi:MAG: hypothetical protein L3J16_04550, partial [Anaerolineales bacterium]|nr:hypothetical protein [Anaerolineales bacterium]